MFYVYNGIMMMTAFRFSIFAFAFLLVAASLVGAGGNAAHAATKSDAQAFIERIADRGIGFLETHKGSPEKQRAAFRDLLRDNFDLNTIGRFAMGKYWRVATPQQRADYSRLFETMIVRVYSERFASYNGQKLSVDGSKELSDTDTMVQSRIIPTDNSSPVKVEWRVRKSGGTFKVVDIVVEGVSMSVTQRSDFSAVIEKGGGNVSVLIDHLRK